MARLLRLWLKISYREASICLTGHFIVALHSNYTLFTNYVSLNSTLRLYLHGQVVQREETHSVG